MTSLHNGNQGYITDEVVDAISPKIAPTYVCALAILNIFLMQGKIVLVHIAGQPLLQTFKLPFHCLTHCGRKPQSA